MASSFVSLIFLKWNPKRIQFILRRVSHLCIFGTKITSIPSYHSTGFSDKFKHAFNIFDTWLNHISENRRQICILFLFSPLYLFNQTRRLEFFSFDNKKKKNTCKFYNYAYQSNLPLRTEILNIALDFLIKTELSVVTNDILG